jgi:sphingomyelin phosphodiesterase
MNFTIRPDPNGVLAFIVEELQAAEDAGQRAWIIAHMPPGRQDTMYDQVCHRTMQTIPRDPNAVFMQSNYFDQIVQRYHNTIAGQFYGHSHQVSISLRSSCV